MGGWGWESRIMEVVWRAMTNIKDFSKNHKTYYYRSFLSIDPIGRKQ